MGKLIKEKICTKCHVPKSISLFYKRVSSDGSKTHSACIECSNTLRKKRIDNLTLKERKALYRIKNKTAQDYRLRKLDNGDSRPVFAYRLSKLKAQAKDAGVNFNLDVNFVMKLFNNQKGKCYYTGKALQIVSIEKIGNRTVVTEPFKMSLDRKIPSKGYIKGNVVWCTFLVNMVKNLLTEEDFYKLCASVLDYRFP